METIKSLRILVTVIRMLKIPHRKTMAKASCQVKPRPKQTVKVKKALRPIPGAKAYGTLAKRPITSVELAAAKSVARKTAWLGMPV